MFQVLMLVLGSIVGRMVDDWWLGERLKEAEAGGYMHRMREEEKRIEAERERSDG